MSRARDVADSNLAVISAGSDGQILTSDGTNWSAKSSPGADGNILTSNGTEWTSAAPAAELPAHGANGNLLTSDGSAWVSQAAAGGGAWTFISEIVSTSSTTVDFSNVFTTTYDNYRITANNVGGDTTNVSYSASVEYSTSTGSYSAYNYYQRLDPSSASTFSYAGGNIFTNNQNNTGSAAQVSNWYVDILNPRSSNAKHAIFIGSGYSGFAGSPVACIFTFLQEYSGTEQSGIRFEASSGTLTGTFRLYGFAKS